MAFNNLYKAGLRRLEYQPSGSSTWYLVPGIQSDDFSPGETPSEEEESHDGKTSSIGTPGPGTLTFEAFYNPLHQSFVDLQDAYRDQTALNFRIITNGRGDLFTASGAGNTAAIDTDGEVTFAGTAQPDFGSGAFKPGQVLTISTDNHRIDTITKSGAAYDVTTRPVPGTAVAATINYKIRHPDTRQGGFSAFVTLSGGQSAPAAGTITTSFSLQPEGVLPDVEIHN